MVSFGLNIYFSKKPVIQFFKICLNRKKKFQFLAKFIKLFFIFNCRIMQNKSLLLLSQDLIENEIFNYTNKNYDTGVRKFKQILKTLISKLNMILVAKSNKNVLKLLDIEELKFPVDINKNIVDKLLKHSDKTGISEAALVNMYS